MKLYIDSSDNLKTTIKIDDKEFIRENTSPRDQDVFGFIVKCISESGLTPQDITEIEVFEGPGSFTGTRIGVTIANALGFALNIKVNEDSIPVNVIYSTPPSTTFPKQRAQ